MSNIPIVQGVAVDPLSSSTQPPSTRYAHDSYQQHTSVPQSDYEDGHHDNGGGGDAYYYGPDYNATPQYEIVGYHEKKALREDPPAQYKDVCFAVLFWLHIAGMTAFIVYNLHNNDVYNNAAAPYSSLLFVTGICGLTAVAICAFSLQWMMKHATTLVQTSLIFSVIVSLAIGVLGFVMSNLLMGIVGLLSFAVGVCYAWLVWSRIPFAVANLHTALTAVQANIGLAALAFFLTPLAFCWTVAWSLGCGDALQQQNMPVVFLLFVSYYWVHEVLKNTMHVTVAGTVGTWWFVPDEANDWWSPALSSSLWRSLTYSFGSICFGSLLVALVRALRALEHYARQNDEMTALVCVIQCFLFCIESIIEFFNRWGFVYVGLYGMDFLTAGKNVVHLFESKGWTAIITDDLCENVLFMASVGVGLASGLVGFILGSMDGDMFASMQIQDAAGPAFLLGFLLGLVIASTFFAVVGSAVNTVIVCYADAPGEFQSNHPELSGNMREAWVGAWPGMIQ